MPITVPPATNYPSPLNALPSRVLSDPREGRKSIPAEIDWGSMGGSNGSVNFNLQNNATLEFSQIVALKVDNSESGASVKFIFPDTMETVSIPAYTPDAIVEVFTNQTQFFVIAEGALSGDITRFQILNFLPPPVVVPTATEQQNASVAAISANAAATTAIIAGGTNGTIENLQVQFGVANAAADSNANFTLRDGTGKIIARGAVYVRSGQQTNVVILNLTNVAVRFEDGLDFTVAGLLIVSGEFSVNVYYKTP